MRFTIRDLLWLITLAAVLTAWFLDRHKIRQERTRLAAQQAKLVSERNIACAEADRASLREIDSREYVSKIMFALQLRGIHPWNLLDPKQQAEAIAQRARQKAAETVNDKAA